MTLKLAMRVLLAAAVVFAVSAAIYTRDWTKAAPAGTFVFIALMGEVERRVKARSRAKQDARPR